MRKLLLLSSTRYLIKNPTVFGKPLADYKILHIITASKGVTNLAYLERNRTFFDEQKCERFEYDLQGKTKAEVQKLLSTFDLVYVEGGNTFLLMKAIRESGFEEVLKEQLQKGLIYMGASAGSYVACPSIEMATWKHQDKYDHYGVTDLKGMNLVPFLITAHYKPEYEEPIKNGSAQAKYPIKVLTDDQVITIEDETQTFIGPEEIKL